MREYGGTSTDRKPMSERVRALYLFVTRRDPMVEAPKEAVLRDCMLLINRFAARYEEYPEERRRLGGEVTVELERGGALVMRDAKFWLTTSELTCIDLPKAELAVHVRAGSISLADFEKMVGQLRWRLDSLVPSARSAGERDFERRVKLGADAYED